MHELSEKEEVLNYIREQYANNNKFYKLLGIKIKEAYKGNAIQTMFIDKDRHTNLYSYIHGGVLLTIGDSSMGVACASLGKRVVTLDTSTSFISNIKAPATITSEASLIHNGRRTIIMQAKILDENRTLLCTMRATYYVVGRFEDLALVQ